MATFAVLRSSGVASTGELNASRLAARSFQNGEPPESRDGRSGLATRSRSEMGANALQPQSSQCRSETSDGVRFTARSGAQNVTISCPVDYVAAEGVTLVSMDIVVRSAEYPNYTQSNSRFDDQWAYSLLLRNTTGDSSVADAGDVNAAHRDTGKIRREFCLESPNADDNGSDRARALIARRAGAPWDAPARAQLLAAWLGAAPRNPRTPVRKFNA
ncbi:MAG: hypothetical protein ACLFQ5_04595 [Oceanicaulis sp.]